ncbi:DUF1302 family protein [Pseudoalteromonas byunsanensis]|uniref:Uncharacterized protein n=1 Tax=Pseudoalteromonas byunsanensis TaxID=327939 RepID=A0A1S1N7L0_9GAMM|nr:DUF1302 family protein [Pseudoalteromonas byunsanensis]OHU95997.1 hypothetical protein BIW53_09350 [Pseudoalteromonas byunsanensis]
MGVFLRFFSVFNFYVVANLLFSSCALSDEIESEYLMEYSTVYNVDESYLNKSELKLKLEFDWELESGKLFFSNTFSFDLGGNLERGNPYENEPSAAGHRIALFGSDNVLFDLREFYYQTELFGHELTVGKQQIAWGQADGVAVLDLVNPIRYREFVLEDLEDARIPLWSVRYDLYFDDFSAQLIWIPDQSYSEFANNDSEFVLTSSRLMPQYPSPYPAEYIIEPVDKPNSVIKDSDYGFEISKQISGLDINVNYLNHYYDRPAFLRFINLESDIPKVTVHETFKKTKTYGFGLNRGYSDYVIRAEVAYSTNRYYIDYDARDFDGVQISPELNYVIGVDYYGFESSMVSFQFYQSRILDYKPTLSVVENDEIITFLYRLSTWNDNLDIEAQWFYDVHDHDGLVRFSGDYRISDNYSLSIYLNNFYGDYIGVFGQYDDRDQIGLNFKWYF